MRSRGGSALATVVVVRTGERSAVPRTFASWDAFWAVRHDATVWEPFVINALTAASLPVTEVVMLSPSQYPTARAGDVIVTIYPDASIAGVSCAMELEALALVAGRGLPLPDLIAHGIFQHPTEDVSWSWLIESAADGVPWTRVRADISDDNARRCATHLGETLRLLHTTPHEGAAVLAPDWTRFIDLVGDETRGLGIIDGRLDGFPESTRRALRDLAEATFAGLDTTAPTALLHGDVHGDNVFVDPVSGGLTALIDLNEMYAGDPWYDLADAVFRLFQGGPGLTRRLLRGYGLDSATDGLPTSLLGWGLLHDFDGLTPTIRSRGLPATRDIDELAHHLTGLDPERTSQAI